MRLGLSREKKKGQALPYLLVCILFLSKPAHCRFRKLAVSSIVERQAEPAPAAAPPGLPVSPVSTRPHFSHGTNLATCPFFKNENKTASAPALLTFACLISKPRKHQSLIKILSNSFCVYLVWLTAPSLLQTSPLGNLCWHFHHRL